MIEERGRAYGLHMSLGLRGLSGIAISIEQREAQLASHFIEDDDYLDVPFIQDKLKRSLIEREFTHKVISLVGQGGIGKTTLVKKVYNEVKYDFDCHIWITVSQSYDVNKLLKLMMQQICVECEHTATPRENETIEELIDSLRRCLQKARYVVVFDDVWELTFWELMSSALPANNTKDSGIIITTRNAGVAATCKETPFDVIYELKTWSPIMAWELFCEKTFKYEVETWCPKELETMSREIVGKCQGVPLNIGVIAGTLSRKRKIKFEWERLLDSLNFGFKGISQSTKILAFSFCDLPYRLKSCFLYFGIFPEDYWVNCERLCALWIAEGFVEAMRDKTVMEEANEYLNELIKRNLVSVEVRSGVNRFCNVHDLTHEFIQSRANDLIFCTILDKKKSIFDGKCRRLSIHGGMNNVSETIKNNSLGIRSFFLFDFNDELTNMSYLVTHFQKLRLLRVLDFEDAPLDCLPNEVGNLFFLRYLSLASTKLKVLPNSIGNLHKLQYLNLCNTLVQMLPKSIGELHNLQTLNVKHTFICELPIEINKLQNLQQIFALCKDMTRDGLLVGVKIQKGFGCLEKLEELEKVEVPAVSGADFVKELEKLTKLKRLSLSNLTKEAARVLCTFSRELKRLENLSLEATSEDEIIDVDTISSVPPPLLHRLNLHGRLQKFPHWISDLWHLQTLYLSDSKLIDDPLKYLKDLPNLMNLQLVQSYEGEQLHFDEGGSQKLKELMLVSLEGLKLVEIDRNAMPFLKTLVIYSCPLLKEVPSGVQHLRNLKELGIKNMSSKFVARSKSTKGRPRLSQNSACTSSPYALKKIIC